MVKLTKGVMSLSVTVMLQVVKSQVRVMLMKIKQFVLESQLVTV